MDNSFSNGGTPSPPEEGAPQELNQGRAALLLVESLMHELVAKGLLSRESFIQVVDDAAEVEHELNINGAEVSADASGSFLYPLSAAFRRELGK